MSGPQDKNVALKFKDDATIRKVAEIQRNVGKAEYLIGPMYCRIFLHLSLTLVMFFNTTGYSSEFFQGCAASRMTRIDRYG